MTSTIPTRQDVLDALLVERIDQRRRHADMHRVSALEEATFFELDAQDNSDYSRYEEVNQATLSRYHHGIEVLQSWRLVQSEVFDWDAASVRRCVEYFDTLKSQGTVGYILTTYGGYIPTSQYTRYVGLAPREEEEEACD